MELERPSMMAGERNDVADSECSTAKLSQASVDAKVRHRNHSESSEQDGMFAVTP
jgi:hypothetical protein